MSQPKRVTTNQSPMRLALILLLSIFTVEFGIMAILLALPPLALSGPVEAVIDASGLSALLFPVLFFVVFRPLARNIKELEQADTALRAMHDQLELRARERTVELEQRNR